jgi:hypothetical protein
MRTHVHTHTHTHKHTHTKTHMHTNTHTHTLNIAPKQHAKLAQACSSRSSSDSNNSKREYICTVSLFITTHMDMKHRGHQRIKFGPDDCMVLRWPVKPGIGMLHIPQLSILSSSISTSNWATHLKHQSYWETFRKAIVEKRRDLYTRLKGELGPLPGV